MLKVLESESQLAALIAHEVAHVIGRHASRGQHSINQQKLLAAVVLNVAAMAVDAPQTPEVDSLSDSLWSRSKSRELEFEADAEAMLILAAASYDPVALPSLLELLGTSPSESGRTGVRWTDSHPLIPERLEACDATIAHLTKERGTIAVSADLRQYAAVIAAATKASDMLSSEDTDRAAPGDILTGAHP